MTAPLESPQIKTDSAACGCDDEEWGVEFMTKRLLCALSLWAAILSPVVAQAAEGYATANVNMRSGPSTAYPAVTMIPAGVPLNINGCLAETPWCDVSFAGGRGWVAGRYVQAVYQQRRVYLGPQYYAPLGIPTIGFDLDNYWGRYYRGRDFYRDRNHWRDEGNWNGRRDNFGGDQPYNRPDPDWRRRQNDNNANNDNADWNRQPDDNSNWDRQRDRRRDWNGQRDDNLDWNNGSDGNQQRQRPDRNPQAQRPDNNQPQPNRQPDRNQPQPSRQPDRQNNRPPVIDNNAGPYSPDSCNSPDCVGQSTRGSNR
jgi:uncharacterized protein YraI